MKQTDTLVLGQPRKKALGENKRVEHYDYIYTSINEGQSREDIVTIIRDLQYQTNCPVWNIAITHDPKYMLYTVAFSTTYGEHPDILDVDVEVAEEETKGYDVEVLPIPEL